MCLQRSGPSLASRGGGGRLAAHTRLALRSLASRASRRLSSELEIARSHEPWRQLLQMDADVALLQEAAPPPDDVARLQDAALPPAEGTGPLDIGPREAWDSHSWNSDWWRGRWSAL